MKTSLDIKCEIIKYIFTMGYTSNISEFAKLPSERFLSEKFKVSRNIIRKIYTQLIEKTIIEKIHGSGYYFNKNILYFMTSAQKMLNVKKIKTSEKINKNETIFLENLGWRKSDCSIKKIFLNDKDEIKGVLYSSITAEPYIKKKMEYPKELIKDLAKNGFVPFIFKKEKVKTISNDWIKKQFTINIADIWVTKQYDENENLYEFSIFIIDSNAVNNKFFFSIN